MVTWDGDLHWFSPAHLLLLVQLKAEAVLAGGIHILGFPIQS